MARDGIDAREAERRIAEEESRRRAYLKQYFHAEPGDYTAFDIVVNTGVLGVDGAVDSVQAALARMPVPAHV
jgi:cytidylate kinase